MNISGVLPCHTYNSELAAENQINEKKLDAVSEQKASKEAAKGSTQSENQTSSATLSAASDYACGYDPYDASKQKEKSNSIDVLDAEKTISDKHKDQLMKQYQFFVGR